VRPRLRSLVLLLALLPAAAARAQDGDALRPCRRADLIGFWEVIRFGFASGATVDRADPAYHLHQRYVFNANATMAYAASEALPTADDNRALLLGPAPATWAVEAGGRLMQQRPGAARVDRSECRVVTRALHDPRSKVPTLPGDVLLTDQGDDDRPITRRLLRKVQATE
jgi:hypothetical protein